MRCVCDLNLSLDPIARLVYAATLASPKGRAYFYIFFPTQVLRLESLSQPVPASRRVQISINLWSGGFRSWKTVIRSLATSQAAKCCKEKTATGMSHHSSYLGG